MFYQRPSDVAVLTGELFLVVVGAIIVIFSVLTWRKYPVLTKEGFLELSLVLLHLLYISSSTP
jgi:hypothetical protein